VDPVEMPNCNCPQVQDPKEAPKVAMPATTLGKTVLARSR
jgi:hypothetical protein